MRACNEIKFGETYSIARILRRCRAFMQAGANPGSAARMVNTDSRKSADARGLYELRLEEQGVFVAVPKPGELAANER